MDQLERTRVARDPEGYLSWASSRRMAGCISLVKNKKCATVLGQFFRRGDLHQSRSPNIGWTECRPVMEKHHFGMLTQQLTVELKSSTHTLPDRALRIRRNQAVRLRAQCEMPGPIWCKYICLHGTRSNLNPLSVSGGSFRHMSVSFTGGAVWRYRVACATAPDHRPSAVQAGSRV